MRRLSWAMFALLALTLVATPALAQQTTGNITGQIVDGQGRRGSGRHSDRQERRNGVYPQRRSDTQGIYRLTALPIGKYNLTAELAGFQKVENKGIEVSVGQTLTVPMVLQLASVQETVTVTGESPLVETGASSVGGVVDVGAHREHAAERPAVREPRRDDSRRRRWGSTPTRPRARSTRRRSAAATAAT